MKGNAVRRSLAECQYGPGGEQTNQEHRPEAVLKTRTASTRGIRACGGVSVVGLVRHIVDHLPGKFTKVERAFGSAATSDVNPY